MGSKKTVFSLIVFILLAGATLVATQQTQIKQIFRSRASETPPATYSLATNQTTVVPNSSFKVSILAKIPSEEANLLVAKITYPPDLLQVTGLDLQEGTTFIKNWVRSQFKNETNPGEILLIGGIPDPGYKTLNPDGEEMAEINFTAKAIGQAKISFVSPSAVYRNLDSSNILQSLPDLTIIINGSTPSATLTPTATPSATPTPRSITPTSTIMLTPTSTPAPTTKPVNITDFNKDGKVNSFDFGFLITKWGKSTNESGGADLNNDGVVNAFDYSAFLKQMLR